jgi:hypothetical protein
MSAGYILIPLSRIDTFQTRKMRATMASQRDTKKAALGHWALTLLARPSHLCVRAALPDSGRALTKSVALRLISTATARFCAIVKPLADGAPSGPGSDQSHDRKGVMHRQRIKPPGHVAGRQLLSCISAIRQYPARWIVRIPARAWKFTRHITVPGVKLEAINEAVSHFRSGSFLHVGHDANG